jgi:hypothetical protein
MHRSWWEKSFGYIWALPLTVVGLLMAIIYLPRKASWHDGCLEMQPRWMIGNPDAQTLGWIVYYRNDKMRANKGLRVHERVHVRQGMRGGVFFGLAYGASWLWYLIFPKENAHYKPRWFAAYMSIWAEVTAYRIQWEFHQGKHKNAWGSVAP